MPANHIEKFPFSDDMAIAALKGVKTKTSRNKRYGAVGDTFTIEPPSSCLDDLSWKMFILTDISEHRLEEVAEFFFKDEGFATPQAFKSLWKQLHPAKGYRPDQMVWVHTFQEVK
jgi:hypothetical protein